MSIFTIDFAQLSANGSTASQKVPLDGDYVLFAFGTFGAGTLTFEASPDDGTTWLSVKAITANERSVHTLKGGELIRATLTGATTPTIDSGIR